jgi:hypothetical protein
VCIGQLRALLGCRLRRGAKALWFVALKTDATLAVRKRTAFAWPLLLRAGNQEAAISPLSAAVVVWRVVAGGQTGS